MKKFYILALLFSIYNSTYSQQENGLNFDGNDDFVNINNTVIDYSNDFTIEFRINSNHESNTGGSSRIFSSSRDNFEIATNTMGLISLHSSLNGWSRTGVSLTNNKWQHVGFVYDGSTMKLYIDGALENTINFELPDTMPADIRIGGRVNAAGGEHANFSIDELRIWNLNRSATEIMNNVSNELSLPQTGLIAYYKFNQGIANGDNSTETTLSDELGNSDGMLNNFTLDGTTSNWITNAALSVNNSNSIEKNLAVYPNPASDYITVSELKKAENFEIYNLIGKNIRKGTISSDESINIQNLIKGMYLLKLENGNTLKFIKE